MDPRFSTAIHEAGHATAHALLIGHRDIVSVSIIADEDTEGRLLVHHGLQPRGSAWNELWHPDDLRTLAIIHLAGRAAAEHLLGRHGPLPTPTPDDEAEAEQSDPRDAGGDYLRALSCVVRIDPDGEHRHEILQWLWARARAFVTAHWHEVMAVAAQLIDRDELSGAEIHRIIRRARRLPDLRLVLRRAS
jgi:ATP-dependent Zn protease